MKYEPFWFWSKLTTVHRFFRFELAYLYFVHKNWKTRRQKLETMAELAVDKCV
jgi:hypothetical protein